MFKTLKSFLFSLTLFILLLINPLTFVWGAGGEDSSAKKTDLVVEIVGSLSKTANVLDYTFIGGNFTNVRVTPFEFIELPYLAIIDRKLGQVSMWRPRLDGQVNDIEVLEDKVYVVGDFKTVDGKSQAYLAVFNASSMNLDSTQYSVSQPINDISFSGSTIILQNQTGSSESIIISVNADKIPTPTPISDNDLKINIEELGFQPPTLGDLMTFAIRIFFVIAGITALFYMLLGAFAWVTSSGDEEAVTAARNKIQSAVIGLIMIVAVLAVIWTLEQAVFQGKICLGLSCPLTLPVLLKE